MSTIIGSDQEIKKSPSFIGSALIGVFVALVVIAFYISPTRKFADGFEIVVYVYEEGKKTIVGQIATTDEPEIAKKKLPCYELKGKKFCGEALNINARPSIICIANC